MGFLDQATLGSTKVEALVAASRRKQWKRGVIVGRTIEVTPRYDVLLEDRTVLQCLAPEFLRECDRPA